MRAQHICTLGTTSESEARNCVSHPLRQKKRSDRPMSEHLETAMEEDGAARGVEVVVHARGDQRLGPGRLRCRGALCVGRCCCKTQNSARDESGRSARGIDQLEPA